MKVLYLTPYPPAVDGIGDYTWLLADSATAAGHEVRVVVPFPLEAAATAPREVMGYLPWRGRPRAELMQAVARWQPDIVHVQFAIAAFGARTAALVRCLDALRRETQIPIVATMHEPERESALMPVVGRLIQRRITSRCDHVIVHTQASRAALVDSVGVPAENVSVIGHLSARPRPASSSGSARSGGSASSGGSSSSSSSDLRARFELGDSRVLLAFGFINAQKGLDDLVEALSLLRDRRPEVAADLRVVIAGSVRPRHGVFRIREVLDRVYQARLLYQIRRRGLGLVIARTGYVPDQDVAGWLDLADAVVLPYRSAEQSGVVGLAQACGVPVLASAVGGLAAQLPESPWLFPPRSPARLAETVAEFLGTTPSQRDATRQPAQPSDDRAAADMLAIYQVVVHARREAQAAHVA
jgi:glycosyltransferase involved in cell wall biosynthesis